MEDKAQIMLETILSRRTANQFRDNDIPNPDIEKLLETAMFAPTRLGKRPWHFVVIRDVDVKEKLVEALSVDSRFAEAPVFIAVLAERLSPEWDLDAAAATENLMIAATAMGLASAWLGGRHSAVGEDISDTFAKLIRMPKEVGLVSVVALGYPAEEMPAKTEAEVYEQQRVHYERWGNTKGV